MRDPDGNVEAYWDYIYDDAGNETTTLYHNVKNNKYCINYVEVTKEEYEAEKAKASASDDSE